LFDGCRVVQSFGTLFLVSFGYMDCDSSTWYLVFHWCWFFYIDCDLFVWYFVTLTISLNIITR